MLRMRCNNCRELLRLKRESVGKRFSCPFCQNVQTAHPEVTEEEIVSFLGQVESQKPRTPGAQLNNTSVVNCECGHAFGAKDYLYCPECGKDYDSTRGRSVLRIRCHNCGRSNRVSSNVADEPPVCSGCRRRLAIPRDTANATVRDSLTVRPGNVIVELDKRHQIEPVRRRIVRSSALLWWWSFIGLLVFEFVLQSALKVFESDSDRRARQQREYDELIKLRADRAQHEAEQERIKKQIETDVLRERIRRGEFTKSR